MSNQNHHKLEVDVQAEKKAAVAKAEQQAREIEKKLAGKIADGKDPSKVLLTTQEAAAFLDCAAITLNLSRCSGILFGMAAPSYIKRGKNGRVFYKLSTLKVFNSQFKERANTAAA